MKTYSINGREYEWADISIRIGNKELSGFRAISYKEEQEIEYYYGKARNPYMYMVGNKKYSGSISMTQSELISLRNSINANIKNSLLDVTLLCIVISYGSENGSNDTRIHTITLNNIRFIEIDEAIEQGDKFMIINMPFLALSIGEKPRMQ